MPAGVMLNGFRPHPFHLGVCFGHPLFRFDSLPFGLFVGLFEFCLKAVAGLFQFALKMRLMLVSLSLQPPLHFLGGSLEMSGLFLKLSASQLESFFHFCESLPQLIALTRNLFQFLSHLFQHDFRLVRFMAVRFLPFRELPLQFCHPIRCTLLDLLNALADLLFHPFLQ
jgi:hypothetical protein